MTTLYYVDDSGNVRSGESLGTFCIDIKSSKTPNNPSDAKSRQVAIAFMNAANLNGVAKDIESEYLKMSMIGQEMTIMRGNIIVPSSLCKTTAHDALESYIDSIRDRNKNTLKVKNATTEA